VFVSQQTYRNSTEVPPKRDSLQIIYRLEDKPAGKVCQGIFKKISRGIFFKKGLKIGKKTYKMTKKRGKNEPKVREIEKKVTK